MAERIIIDPGHGGFDAGASYQNRKEKDDNLQLALAVGQLLEQDGYDVIYTRTVDQYDSPFDKAQIANNAQGDLFVSFHRNSSERPNQYHGIQALVYGNNPLANRVAENVNANLEKLGFRNIGTEQRKELVVLRRTAMPAVLLEVGFINSDKDNQLFEEKFTEIAGAIASGIKQALPSSSVTASAKNTFFAPLSEEPSIPAAADALDTITRMQTPEPSSADIPMVIPSTEESGSPIPDVDISQIPQTLPWLEMPPDLPGNNVAPPIYDPGRPQTPGVNRPGQGNNRPNQGNRPGQNNNQGNRPGQNNNQGNRPGQSGVRPIVIPVQCQNGKCTVGNIPYYYYIQVGLFRQPQNAVYLMGQLRQQGYPVIWHRVSGLIAIWVGPKSTLDEAVQVQHQLQDAGYDTLLVTDRLIQ